MKRNTIFVILSLFACVLHAQETSEQELRWDYPVKPGRAEWADFKTGLQRFDACQIPQSVLADLNTKDLALICFNYPLYIEYTFSNNERRWISDIIEEFSGLNELSKRRDGVRELVYLYQSLPVFDENRKISDKTSYPLIFKIAFVELLLADESFVKQMDEQMADELANIIVNKYEETLAHIHAYGVWSIQKTFLLGAVVVEKQGKSSGQLETLRRFIENYRNPEASLMTEMSQIISGL